MSDASFAKVNKLFHAALELPETDREQFLQTHCGGDEALLFRLRAMLEQDAQAQNEAEDDPLAAAVQSGQKQFKSAPQPLPELIGPFKLLRKLGQGGMGAIYLAERSDSDFEQQVAIKLLRDLDASTVTRARLRRERRVLASLEHPNIARLIDGGELEDGTPYVVMEYVEGVNITVYADQKQLDWNARLDLFLQLLDAVAYAHRNLIVHRDIKPDNVLVDTQGNVKLLDFGIAKLLGEPNNSLAGSTMTVAHAMTPCYASPEQLLGQTVSTQTDVYSLGVVLYELLTASLPFAPEPGQSELHLRNHICTTQALPPSKVRTSVTPQRRLRGDLDNIVLKALRKEPDRRYQSVSGFKDDIRLYLAGRPVSARADSWTYRTRKLITRNPVGFAVSLLLLATLLAFAVTSRWQALRYASERDRAESEASAAGQVAEYMVSLFQVPDPIESTERNLTAKDLLDKAAASLAQEMDDAPLLRARMMHVIGLSYANTGDYESAVKMLTSALTIRESELGPDSLEASDSLNRIGNVYRMYGQLDLARQSLASALAIREKLATGPNTELADAYNNVGLLQYQLGQYPQALETLQKAIDMHRDAGNANSVAIAVALHNRALALQSLARYVDAEAEAQQSIAIKLSLGLQDRSTTINSQALLSSLLFNEGRLRESLELRTFSLAKRRELYPQGHPSLISGLIGLGRLKMLLGDPEAADELLAEALNWADKIDSSAHSMTAKVLLEQGRLNLATGDVNAAREKLDRALEIRSAALDANHLDLAQAQYLAGIAALANDDLRAAKILLQTSLQQRQAQLPANHPEVRETQLALAVVDAREGKPEIARKSITSLIRGAPDVQTLRSDWVTAWAYICLAELPLASHTAASEIKPQDRELAATTLLANYFKSINRSWAGPNGQCLETGWLHELKS